MPEITLRKAIESDLEIFFENQKDEEANHMAAFTAKDPNDREAYMQKWKHLLANGTGTIQTILVDGVVVGSVLTFDMDGETNVSYGISKAYWGQGITTQALKELLNIITGRPLYGRAATDNVRSIRVMEKCGFKQVGNDSGFANARGCEIPEYIYRLD